MSAIDNMPRARAAAAWPAWSDGIVNLLRQLRAAIEARGRNRTRRRNFLDMARLDDRTLDDIGLSRTDIETASRLPLEINASHALRQMAAERRSAEMRRRRR